MLTCPQKRLASVLLLRKGFLLTFNSNNTFTLISLHANFCIVSMGVRGWFPILFRVIYLWLGHSEKE